MLGWWTGLPSWLRYLVALVFLGFGVAIVFFIHGRNRYRGAGTFLGVGFVMLCFAGKSEAEKNGYRF